MRIAHIITRLIVGGAQENTLLSCEDLIRTYGDDVLLITGPTTGPEGTLMDRAAKNVPTVVLPNLIRNISPFADGAAYREIRDTLREFKPDVVHTHSAKAGILGRAAAWKLGVPAIVHGVHGAPFYPYQNFLIREFYKSCERWAARRCHAFVCVADAMTDLMAGAKIAPRGKFTTIYSGMEVEPFLESDRHREEARRMLGFSDENIVIGKIARLFRLKGHEFVIEAAGKIVRKTPRARFLFVGDGILIDTHKAAIARAGLEKYFVFVGLVPPDRVPAMISAMDVVVHTSLREGLARVLPQALISGKPVVSYDVDGAREVVLDGETGFLLPPKSVDELADAVIRLAEDAPLRETLGQEGRRRFARQFDHRYMTEQIRTLYEKLLWQKGTPVMPILRNLFFLAALLSFAVFSVAGEVAPANYDEDKIPAYTLPDPLTMEDGRKVETAEQWEKERRPEILELFKREMFGGDLPLNRTLSCDLHPPKNEVVFDGKGIRHQWEIVYRTENPSDEQRITVLAYTPKPEKVGQRFPAFVGLNFGGNHTVHADPGITLGKVWDDKENRYAPAKGEDRGKASRRWPVELLLRRGYGLVTAYYGDFEPDTKDGIRHGVRRFLYDKEESPKPDEANAIGIWASGLCFFLETLNAYEEEIGIDPKKVAVVGHSRLGKTALWAGALCPDFALVVSNNSGCGGAALSRREFGETVHRINTAFPHWFCGNFKKYNKAVNDCPVDQHELIALIAPRPVYVASAAEDLWADPKGEFLACLHAEPVYRLLGTDGLAGTTEMPAVDTPVGGRIGYHIRTGKHDIIEYDWKQYLDFADKHFGK